MHFNWTRGAASIEDGNIYFLDPRKPYSLPLRPGPKEKNGNPAYVRFLALKQAPEEQVEAFASRFGQLDLIGKAVEGASRGDEARADLAEAQGFPEVAAHLRQKKQEARQKALKRRLEGKKPPPQSEPLAWWRREAGEMKQVVEAANRLLEEANEMATTEDKLKFLQASHVEVIEPIRAKLVGRMHFDYVEGTGFTLLPKPQSLLEALYVQLVTGLTASSPRVARPCANARCPNGGWFVPNKRSDSEYCETRCRKAASSRRNYKPRPKTRTRRARTT